MALSQSPPRLRRAVAFSSDSPGAGKTTTSRRLAQILEQRGEAVTWVPESVIFDWSELADLAAAFRSPELSRP